MRGLQKSVLNFCEDEKEKSRELLKWLEAENTKKAELISRQREFFDEILARRQHLISKIIDTEKVKKKVEITDNFSKIISPKVSSFLLRTLIVANL